MKEIAKLLQKMSLLKKWKLGDFSGKENNTFFYVFQTD